MTQKILSIVLPVYQGEELVENAIQKLLWISATLPADWRLQIVAVDDGSTDSSFERIKIMRRRHPGAICAIRLAKNHGAITALRVGLIHAHGDLITFAAQDLQESPEMLLSLFQSWLEHGEKVQAAYRTSRKESAHVLWPAKIYYFLFRKFIMPDFPAGGIATMLIDKTVIDALKQNMQWHVDLGTEIASFGFSTRWHPIERIASGRKSLWGMAKKIKLALDNIISFSHLPLRFLSSLGMVVAMLGFMLMAYVLVGKTTGLYRIYQPPGWATQAVLLSVFFGFIILTLGLIGEYLWRILDYVRGGATYYMEDYTEHAAMRRQPRRDNQPAPDAEGIQNKSKSKPSLEKQRR